MLLQKLSRTISKQCRQKNAGGTSFCCYKSYPALFPSSVDTKTPMENPLAAAKIIPHYFQEAWTQKCRWKTLCCYESFPALFPTSLSPKTPVENPFAATKVIPHYFQAVWTQKRRWKTFLLLQKLSRTISKRCGQKNAGGTSFCCCQSYPALFPSSLDTKTPVENPFAVYDSGI